MSSNYEFTLEELKTLGELLEHQYIPPDHREVVDKIFNYLIHARKHEESDNRISTEGERKEE